MPFNHVPTSGDSWTLEFSIRIQSWRPALKLQSVLLPAETGHRAHLADVDQQDLHESFSK